jgi:hypothetical protein
MKRAGLLAILALCVAAAWLLNRKSTSVATGAPCPCPSDSSLPKVEQSPSPALTVLRDTDFDSRFGRDETTPAEDLNILQEVLGHARMLIKDHHGIPLADNADFVRFLGGSNPHHVAWIRPGHPAVNESGELTDRWGTAIFFHQESSSQTSLRSAGPDRVFWTDDDLVLENLEGGEHSPTH